MAADTAQKRASVACILMPFNLCVAPSGTVDQSERQQAGWLYAGLTFTEAGRLASVPGEDRFPSIDADDGFSTVPIEDRFHTVADEE